VNYKEKPATNRSTDGPSPHEPSVCPGDHNAVVCRGSRVPRDSQAAHSHCGRNVPTASENVCIHRQAHREPTVVSTLESINYSATSNNINLVHWLLMGGPLHLVQRGGDWAGPQPAQAPPRCSKRNSPPINDQCTNHNIAA